MSEHHTAVRAGLVKERAHLLGQIDELTVGGEIDLDFDDDFADRGQVAGEQGENRVLAETLQTQLDRVERALERLDDGSYGTCTACGAVIGRERLEAMPATDRCIQHAA